MVSQMKRSWTTSITPLETLKLLTHQKRWLPPSADPVVLTLVYKQDSSESEDKSEDNRVSDPTSNALVQQYWKVKTSVQSLEASHRKLSATLKASKKRLQLLESRIAASAARKSSASSGQLAVERAGSTIQSFYVRNEFYNRFAINKGGQ